jgi:hypothetical protein
MKRIKLSELISALEFDSEEHETRIDRQEGRVVAVDSMVLRAVEDGDDEVLQDLPDWQKEEVEIARVIVEDSVDRFAHAPDKFDFNEYRHMERFVGMVEDAEAADQLWRAIKGKGAFRYFKDTVARLGLLERWYQYRDDSLKDFVIDWAKAHNVSCEDDTKNGGHEGMGDRRQHNG